VFFWEKFMTKPLVDDGRFRRVGEFLAPWPAFVLCVAEGLGASQRQALGRLLQAVLDQAQALAGRPDAPAVIGARYSLQPADVADWLRATRWARHVGVDPGDLASVTTALTKLELVPAGFQAKKVSLTG
jgi:sulfonate transport system substrate-binding protein